ncbi:hypothetical protein LTT95_06870 [Luteimonas sp. A1P009]|uniref:Uncharacterized protein n=1 Tax=Luteimonas fraxinea TaxID=2901869 RepID=A0ABS8UCR1_9GAMM|nr:hypothetical protein [Luteimonas fraxinea]MCD9096662.1 hypothetical protein [Luteimonas fraxinea]
MSKEHLEALSLQRLAVLRHSENHLTRVGLHATMSTVLKHLEPRWARPRWAAFVLPHAGGAVIGWVASQTSEAHSEAGAWMRHAYGGEVHDVDGWMAFDVPEKFFQAAVWHLIDHHVLAVDLSDRERGGDATRRWEDCWRVRPTSLQSNQKRRETTHEFPWPTPPPARSASARAVQARSKRADHREREAKARWLEARERIRQRDDEQAAGLGRDYLPGEREALRADVDGLATHWASINRGFKEGRAVPS